jgi:aldehyde oxidoreductase
MNSTAPAVINAINDACGVRIYDLPATPDKIKKALK